jgi:hypothetical protein
LRLNILAIFEHFLIDSELNGIDGGACSQVVHSSLQALLPAVKVHACQLSKVGFSDMNIQTLRLVDKGTAIGSHVDNGAL